MTGFIQIIEWRTSRIEDVEKLQQEWRETHPRSGPTRIQVGKDRDDDGAYVTVVEFDSYEEAMANSADPATGEFAERMGALCDGPPRFRNLDLIHLQARDRASAG